KKPSRIYALTRPVDAINASTAATTSRYTCTNSISRRRSTMSAIAPAGSASSITGRLSAASTSATSAGEEDSDVINQPAPTSCIQVPTFETIVAIQRLRNSVLRSGVQGPTTAAVPGLGTAPAGADVMADAT